MMDNLYKACPMCVLENVIPTTVKTFAYTIYIFWKQPFNIKSKQSSSIHSIQRSI